MIIIINGSLGVGKTSVAEHLTVKFEKAVHLDGDAIGDVHPFEIYDDARITHLYRTLALLIEFHQRHGYPDFVINYVFESHTSLEELLSLLRSLDPDIHAYWLTCGAEEQEQRIRARSRDQIGWELERFIELQAIQAQAAEKGFIGTEMDTTGLCVEQVVEKIWGMVSE
jgi:broad-specificity NMP kinase